MLTHFHEVLVLRELVMQVVCLINSTTPSQVVREDYEEKDDEKKRKSARARRTKHDYSAE
jgi:hypothetical protein|eukprot:COSAG02_NODE_7347_length_3053_cov_4.215978_2_plen_60_part_00